MGATIAEIKEEIAKATIEISIEYSNNKPRAGRAFHQTPGPFLMKECDEKSRELQQQLGNEFSEHIPHLGPSTPVHKASVRDKAVTTLIREIDAGENELNYAQSKLPEYWE